MSQEPEINGPINLHLLGALPSAMRQVFVERLHAKKPFVIYISLSKSLTAYLREAERLAELRETIDGLRSQGHLVKKFAPIFGLPEDVDEIRDDHLRLMTGMTARVFGPSGSVICFVGEDYIKDAPFDDSYDVARENGVDLLGMLIFMYDAWRKKHGS